MFELIVLTKVIQCESMVINNICFLRIVFPSSQFLQTSYYTCVFSVNITS